MISCRCSGNLAKLGGVMNASHRSLKLRMAREDFMLFSFARLDLVSGSRYWRKARKGRGLIFEVRLESKRIGMNSHRVP